MTIQDQASLRDVLMLLLDLRTNLQTLDVDSKHVRNLQDLINKLFQLARARGELCGCCAECTDEAYVGSAEAEM